MPSVTTATRFLLRVTYLPSFRPERRGHRHLDQQLLDVAAHAPRAGGIDLGFRVEPH